MYRSALAGPASTRRAVWLAGLSRPELFAGLFVLGFANGIFGRAYGAIAHGGVVAAAAGTLGISVVVWVAAVIVPGLLLGAPRTTPSHGDLAVALCALAGFLLPFNPLSWIGLTGLALHMLRGPLATRGGGFPSPERRAAWIILGVTGAMFWGRLLMDLLSGPILAADAVLAGWFAGTPHSGNTVQFSDGGGYLCIAPGCSSLSNVSIAILCWVLFAQARGLGWTLGRAGWCLLACLSVVAVNAARLGLMALHREQFDLIHGPIGSAAASWLSMAAMLAICSSGTRRARPFPAY